MLTFDRIQFMEAVRFASHAMAAKDVRYYLNGMLFEFRSSQLNLVATDGHRMAMVELSGSFEDINTDLICKTADIKTLISVVKAVKGFVSLTAGQDSIRFEGSDFPALDFKAVEGKFPDWRRVMPQGATAPTSVIGVNSIYLAEAGKAATRMSGKYSGVRMEMRGPDKSIWIAPDLRSDWDLITKCGAVVMPMRL